MQASLFTNALIFDGNGEPSFPGHVLVKDEKITDVFRGSQAVEGIDADIIDCQGKTLMPGLIESHAHLSWPSSVGRVMNVMKLPPEEHLLVTAHNARVLLDSGFTSAYSAGSLGARFEIALRNEIEGGYLPGPRLRASSTERSPGGVLGVPQTHGKTERRDTHELQAFVREAASDGIDTIKFLLSGDDGFSPGGSETLMYSAEEVQAIGVAAREANVWLAAHAQAAEAVKLGVRNGFRILYHCSYADTEALDLLEEHRADVFVAPAVALLYTRVYEAEEFGITKEVAERMGATSGLERMQTLYPEMRRRGIRVLPGGDYGFPYNPIGRNARDLEFFVTLFGFTPAEVLCAATKFGGELMGFPGELGVIESGWLADILVVNGDPTADIRVLQDQDALEVIMKGGQFHKRRLPVNA